MSLAFGFELTPLVARAEEFEALAAEVQADRKALRLARERITLARRDLGCLDSEPADYTELNARMDEYMDEFEKSGVENLVLET